MSKVEIMLTFGIVLGPIFLAHALTESDRALRLGSFVLSATFFFMVAISISYWLFKSRKKPSSLSDKASRRK